MEGCLLVDLLTMTKRSLFITRLDRNNVDLNRLFSRVNANWQSLLPLSDGKWQPNTDVLEAAESYIIRMELAGVRKEDINILYQDGRLLIYGQRRDPVTDQRACYVQLEIHYHDFERLLILPDEIVEAEIEAKLEEGILWITVPKPKQSQIERKIKVEVK